MLSESVFGTCCCNFSVDIPQVLFSGKKTWFQKRSNFFLWKDKLWDVLYYPWAQFLSIIFKKRFFFPKYRRLYKRYCESLTCPIKLLHTSHFNQGKISKIMTKNFSLCFLFKLFNRLKTRPTISRPPFLTDLEGTTPFYNKHK